MSFCLWFLVSVSVLLGCIFKSSWEFGLPSGLCGVVGYVVVVPCKTAGVF